MSYFGFMAGRVAGAITGVFLLSLGLSAAARADNFETVLGPTPLNNSTKETVTGVGEVTATLAGDKLTVTGKFVGLTTAATDAHLMVGSGMGIPGAPILDLTVAPATSGTLTGSFKLSRVQLAALMDGKIYVQLNSQKAPAPGGNLWGWLLPEHKKAGQYEPQQGDWFLPQGKGLKAQAGKRQS